MGRGRSLAVRKLASSQRPEATKAHLPFPLRERVKDIKLMPYRVLERKVNILQGMGENRGA